MYFISPDFPVLRLRLIFILTMPVLSLQKVHESLNPEEKEQVARVEMNIPDEVFAKILFMLDGRSLHKARQVSQEWNSVVKAQVLGTREGRREMERTLQFQWREAAVHHAGLLEGRELRTEEDYGAFHSSYCFTNLQLISRNIIVPVPLIFIFHNKQRLYI